MADFEPFEMQRARGADGVRPRNIGTLVNWAGAVLSVGLIVGMAVWAVKLTLRDVSGVPVIRALEGPMRIAPADPGGVQAEHQGLAVNRIAEGGEAGPVPDSLVLAPPPVDLTAVSFSTASPSVSPTASAPVLAVAPMAGATDAAPVQGGGDPAAPSSALVNAETQALIERLLERADPLPVPATGTAQTAQTPPEPAPEAAQAPAAVQVIPASVPGIARSLRPPLRPITIAASAAARPDMARAAQDIDPTTLAEGTRLVQLGAFDTADIARAEWDRLTGRFPDYFAGRARVIQQASSGGSAFYRLRAHGFDDLAASRRFCSALMAQGAPCIPVTVR